MEELTSVNKATHNEREVAFEVNKLGAVQNDDCSHTQEATVKSLKDPLK